MSSTTKPPSSYAVMNAVNELSNVREMLCAICPEIEEDVNEKLFTDMLEGEAPDALAVIERLIEASVESDALADAAKARQADLADRRARFERRRDAYRAVALQAMEQIHLRRLERPAWTASIANRPRRVLITDESALDEIYVRVKREPDKAAIAAGLKNGDTVRGASLSNGGTGLDSQDQIAMNAITTTTAPPMAFGDLERLADAIAKSQLFGIKTKDQALVLMMIAHAEGRHPALAARDYDIVQGRPAKKAEAMLRDFLQAGGKVEWHSLTDELADATFTHPQTGSVRIDWDMKRAVTAFGKEEMYAKFPRQMLRSRVVSEGVRTLWPLATSGMYVPEEVADIRPEHNGPTIEHGASTEREAINAEVPIRPAATPQPPAGNKALPHSIAPPPGAPDEAWRACLAKVGPALLKLRTAAMVEAVADGPTCGDIMQHGPEWAKAELAQMLADNVARFRTVENAPEFASAEAEPPAVEIAGEAKMAAG